MQLRIKEVAKSKGFTMKAIAEALGTSQAMVTYYEKGQVDISLDKLREIAQVLNCEMFELIPTNEHYGHFYVGKEYQGIRKV